MNKIESLDLEVKEFIKKAETDSSIKASLERTMGINWYSKALFQLLSRIYSSGDFTRLSEVFCQITKIPLEEAFEKGCKIFARDSYFLNKKDYITCEGYAVIISGKRKVINNE